MLERSVESRESCPATLPLNAMSLPTVSGAIVTEELPVIRAPLLVIVSAVRLTFPDVIGAFTVMDPAMSPTLGDDSVQLMQLFTARLPWLADRSIRTPPPIDMPVIPFTVPTAKAPPVPTMLVGEPTVDTDTARVVEPAVEIFNIDSSCASTATLGAFSPLSALSTISAPPVCPARSISTDDVIASPAAGKESDSMPAVTFTLPELDGA